MHGTGSRCPDQSEGAFGKDRREPVSEVHKGRLFIVTATKVLHEFLPALSMWDIRKSAQVLGLSCRRDEQPPTTSIATSTATDRGRELHGCV